MASVQLPPSVVIFISIHRYVSSTSKSSHVISFNSDKSIVSAACTLSTEFEFQDKGLRLLISNASVHKIETNTFILFIFFIIILLLDNFIYSKCYQITYLNVLLENPNKLYKNFKFNLFLVSNMHKKVC